MKKTQENRRIVWIDSLKGIAMILVLMLHTGSGKGVFFFSDLATNPFLKLGGYGWIGVVLFFLISGFLSYKSLYAYFEKNTYSFKTIFTWIRKKFIRYIPLFYLTIFIGVFWKAHYYWLGNRGSVSLENLGIHLLFLHGFFPNYCANILGVEWYIGVLAIFLCLVPFLFKYIRCLKNAILLFILSLPLSYTINELLDKFPPSHVYHQVYQNYVHAFGFIEHFSTLCLGIILYFIYVKFNQINISHKKGLSYLLIVFSIIFLYANMYYPITLFLINSHTIWACTFSLLILSQMLHQSCIVCNPFFYIIGKHTWTIYLFHFYLVDLYRKYLAFKTDYSFLNWSIEFFTVLLFSLILSVFLVKFLDQPCQRILNKKFFGH